MFHHIPKNWWLSYFMTQFFKSIKTFLRLSKPVYSLMENNIILFLSSSHQNRKFGMPKKTALFTGHYCCNHFLRNLFASVLSLSTVIPYFRKISEGNQAR